MCFTTGSIPQMLYNLQGADKTISYLGCAIQLYWPWLWAVEVCSWLSWHMTATLQSADPCTTWLCTMPSGQLASAAWLSGFGNSLIMAPQTLMRYLAVGTGEWTTFSVMPALIGMACVDTMTLEALAFALAIFIILAPLILILVSYGYIARAVLRIKSAAGRKKAFNTCSSHLIVVSLFYGTIISHVPPASKYLFPGPGQVPYSFYTQSLPVLTPNLHTEKQRC